ncbi:unnamed protein product [Amoebophrya sp. A120]|nr:unnamed protein product [Amoebophrya sp. A120]|eukprot:GSA120T00018886001.1
MPESPTSKRRKSSVDDDDFLDLPVQEKVKALFAPRAEDKKEGATPDAAKTEIERKRAEIDAAVEAFEKHAIEKFPKFLEFDTQKRIDATLQIMRDLHKEEQAAEVHALLSGGKQVDREAREKRHRLCRGALDLPRQIDDEKIEQLVDAPHKFFLPARKADTDEVRLHRGDFVYAHNTPWLPENYSTFSKYFVFCSSGSAAHGFRNSILDHEAVSLINLPSASGLCASNVCAPLRPPNGNRDWFLAGSDYWFDADTGCAVTWWMTWERVLKHCLLEQPLQPAKISIEFVNGKQSFMGNRFEQSGIMTDFAGDYFVITLSGCQRDFSSDRDWQRFAMQEDPALLDESCTLMVASGDKIALIDNAGEFLSELRTGNTDCDGHFLRFHRAEFVAVWPKQAEYLGLSASAENGLTKIWKFHNCYKLDRLQNVFAEFVTSLSQTAHEQEEELKERAALEADDEEVESLPLRCDFENLLEENPFCKEISFQWPRKKRDKKTGEGEELGRFSVRRNLSTNEDEVKSARLFTWTGLDDQAGSSSTPA